MEITGFSGSFVWRDFSCVCVCVCVCVCMRIIVIGQDHSITCSSVQHDSPFRPVYISGGESAYFGHARYLADDGVHVQE